MKQLLLLFTLATLGSFLHSINAQPKLSENAKISLMTSAPYDDEVFTVYGHAALRIQDSIQKIDYIFNYGIFDFSKPNFIYRFAKGETDYILGVIDYPDYAIEYLMRGSNITEQELNLTTEEKNRVWEALCINYKPTNRTYRYNFFFDNCATRPAAILEKTINGQIKYNYPYQPQTFRDLINHCTRNHPWLTFGCDLALGAPTDRLASQHEMLFLPPYLKEAFSTATIINKKGEERSLINKTNIIESGETNEIEKDIWDIFTPITTAWILFICIFYITFYEWHKKRYFFLIDFILFAFAGIAGCILFFISFISVHPCTFPNWSLLWLQPLDLIAAILFCAKRLKKAAYYYHFINFAALTLMLLGWHFIPQHLNNAFIPLVASIWVRSGWGVYRKTWKIG